MDRLRTASTWLPPHLVTRLIGIGLIVGAALWSGDHFLEALREVDAAPPSPAVAVAKPQTPAEARADRLAEAEPPEYLHYAAGFTSGIHTVADAPSSTDDEPDDDNTLRRPSQGRRSRPAYPTEYDLVPDASLAARGEVQPGLYATSFDTKGCGYELRRVMKDRTERVIGADRLDRGRLLVSINEIEPDGFTSLPQCGDWLQWSPLVEPLSVAPNGDYWIGDLEPGSWDVPAGCAWETVVGFRGAELADVVESGIGPEPLVIDDETPGLRIRRCRPGTALVRADDR